MTRKDRQRAAANLRQNLALYMADRFKEHRKRGINPVTALQLVDGDLNGLMRKNPHQRSEIERARQDFHVELQLRLAVVPA